MFEKQKQENEWFSLNNILIAAGALVLVLMSSMAQAQAKTPPSAPGAAEQGRFVQELADEAISTLTRADISAPARQQRFHALFAENVDFPAIARFVLGRYWRSASEGQRDEFIGLFRDLTVFTYTARLTEYSNEIFQVNEVRPASHGDTIVRSVIARPSGGPPLRLDWRIRPQGKGYKVVDLFVEGVSLSLTQRSQYSSVLSRNGGQLSDLLAALRKKVAYLSKQN
jgi:phospholipid transport system substrate-binding protein